MKFGKLILRTQIPEWSRYYLDYKGLKQRVKRCVGKDAAGISESQDENDVENEVTAFFFALDRELEKINDFYTLKLAEIKRRLWIFAEKFGRSTPSETISANGTPLSPLSPSSSQALKSRKRRSSLLSGPLSDSGSPLHSRQSSMNEDSDKCDGIAAHQQEQLFMALAETRVQVGKLRAFTEMNAKGVGKILKKFDKRTQSMTRQVYLTQKLEPLAFASSASLRALELYVKDWMKDVETELRGFRSSNALGRELSTIESDERRELDETNERNRARMAKRQELNSILGSDNLEAFQDWQQRGARTKAGRYLQLRQACYYQAYKIIEHLIEAGPVLLDPEDVNERSILHLLALHGGRLPKLYLDTTEEEARVFQTMEDAQRGLLKVHNIVFPVGVTTGASTEKRPIKANNSNEDTALLEFILSKLPPQTRIAQQDINGCTPIHVAVLQGYPNTARILLRHARTRSHEYDTNPVSGVTFLDECWLDKDVRSPLFCAVSRTREDGGNIECLEAICQEAGLLEWPHRDEAESQSISELLQMHLLIGCQFNVAPAVRYLVHSTQARCDILDESGETALMAACQAGATECVAEVLAGRGGMDVLNHQEPEEGWTALFMAASDGKRDIVQLLIDAKADVSLKDEAGWTAHDHAVFRGYMDTAAVIKPFIDPYVPPVAAENRQKGDTKEKDHSDASSPHLPVQDARRVYGHQYLEEECLIVLTVGSNDIRRQGTFLTIDTSHLGSGYSGPYTISVKAINATGETAIVDVPAQVTSEASLDADPFIYKAKREDLCKVVFMIDIVPTYGGILDSPQSSIARGTMMLVASNIFTHSTSTLYPTAQTHLPQPALRGYPTVPLIEPKSMMPIGHIKFEYLIITPFQHENLSIAHRNTYWRTLESHVNRRTNQVKLIGHRGFGMNKFEPTGRLQIGENTIESFVTASNLGAEYVEFDVQLTKDRVPVLYHDWIVSESGFDIPMNAITFEQFLNLRPSGRTSSSHLGARVPRLPQNGDDLYTKDTIVPEVAASREMLKNDISSSSRKQPGKVSRSNSLSALRASTLLDVDKRMEYTKAFKDKKTKGNGPGSIQAPYTSLEEAFMKVPSHIGFNIEIKYPMNNESEDDMVPCHQELNLFIDSILDVIYTNAVTTVVKSDGSKETKHRNIILSSFSPEVCLMLNAKQPNLPVFFLTDAGVELMSDQRCDSLQGAVRFAKQAGLFGIVSASEPIIEAPRIVSAVKKHGLVVFSYGVRNNVVENVRLQKACGVDGVIVDSVVAVRKGLQS